MDLEQGVILVRHRNGVAKYKKNIRSFAFVKDASFTSEVLSGGWRPSLKCDRAEVG